MTLETVELKMIRLKYLSIILFSIFFTSTHGKAEPENKDIDIKCLGNSVEIKLLQNESFSGNIYVRGHEEEDICKKTYKDAKQPTFFVQHEPCAPKKDNIVEIIAVIKPSSGSKVLRTVKCDYSPKKVKAKKDIQILPTPTPIPSTPNPTSIEDIKKNLHDNVMKLWKTINDALCDCNLKNYVNKIKSIVKLPE